MKKSLLGQSLFGLALTLSHKMNDRNYCLIALISWYLCRPFSRYTLYFIAYNGLTSIKVNRKRLPLSFLKQHSRSSALLLLDAIKWKEEDKNIIPY